MTTIKLKNGSGAPTAGDLVQGEPALDLTNKRLYTEDSGGTVIEVGTNPTSITTGDITATGTATFANLATSGDITFGDNDKAIFGAGSDLQIYHNGTDSIIDDNGTGSLKLQTGASTKLEVTSTGIDVTGTAEADGLKVEAAAPVLEISSTTLSSLASINFTSGGSDIDSKITHQGNTGVMTIDSGRNATWGGKIDFVTDTDTRMRIDNSGDISFYNDAGSSQDLYWDASTSRLGLGTTSPDAVIEANVTTSGSGANSNTAGCSIGVGTTATTQPIVGMRWTGASHAGISGLAYVTQIVNDTTNSNALETFTTGATPLVFGTNATERMRITSTGNVELPIGNDQTIGQVFSTAHSSGNVGSIGLTISDGGGHSGVFVNNAHDGTYSDQSITFKTAEGGVSSATERMRINSSGNVGIGTNNPTARLEIAYSGGSQIEASNGSGTFRILNDGTNSNLLSNGPMFYQTNATGEHIFQQSGGSSEAMRIDSLGNLLVGKTSSAFGTAGVEINATGVAGAVFMTRSAGDPLALNRLSTDGVIQSFYKDSTQVGSIGVVGSDILYIGTSDGSDAGLNFDGDNSRINPCNGTGAATNGALDLGQSGARFKDLYLSGRSYSVGITNYTNALRLESLDTSVNNAESIGVIEFAANDSSSGGTGVQAKITAEADNSFGTAYALTFETGTGASPSEKVRISSSGLVGIGTSLPSAELEIESSTAELALDSTGSSFSRVVHQHNGSAVWTTGTRSASDYHIYRESGSGNVIVDAGDLLVSGTSLGQADSIGMASTGIIYSARASGASQSHAIFYNGSSVVGSITTSTTATAYNVSSDQRLKENIVDAPSASDDIDAIQVRSFDWKINGEHQKYGMVAQELNTVAPDAVTIPDDPEEMAGVDYSKLVPMLVKEIQSLRARVAQLEGAN